MSIYAERGALLARELLSNLERMADALTGRSACLFLDRLERLERLEAHLDAHGREVLDTARAVRAESGEKIAEAAADALDLDGLAERGFAIAGGGEEDPAGFVSDALLVAEIAPRLPGAARVRADRVLELVASQVGGMPGAFAGAADLAEQRRVAEPLGQAPVAVRSLVAAFARAPRVAEDDAIAEQLEPSKQARDAFDARIRQERARAEPSLLDRIRKLFDDAVEAGARGVVAGRAAARGEVPPHALLRRAWNGEFLIRRDADRLWLEWFGDDRPRVFERHGDGTVELTPEPVEGGLRWPLDASRGRTMPRWAELGPDRVDLGTKA